MQLRLGKRNYMWRWTIQTKLSGAWLQKLIETWNIGCIDVSIILRSSHGKYGLGWNVWNLKINQKLEGSDLWELDHNQMHYVGSLNNSSASFYCMYFFNIVRHHIYHLHIQYKSANIKLFFLSRSVAKKSLSEVWFNLKPFTLKCMCTLHTWTLPRRSGLIGKR